MSEYALAQAEERICFLENLVQDLRDEIDDLHRENMQLAAERDRLEAMADL